jgi:hypothetical protein
MHGVSQAVAACALATLAVGCGVARAPQSARHVPAPGGTASQASAMPAGSGARPRCHKPAPTVRGQRALLVTTAANQRTYCVHVGDKVEVELAASGRGRWLQPVPETAAVTPLRGTLRTHAGGSTVAWFAAARPGQARVAAVQWMCAAPLPPGKGDLEPASPLPRPSPSPRCTASRHFTVLIIVRP